MFLIGMKPSRSYQLIVESERSAFTKELLGRNKKNNNDEREAMDIGITTKKLLS